MLALKFTLELMVIYYIPSKRCNVNYFGRKRIHYRVELRLLGEKLPLHVGTKPTTLQTAVNCFNNLATNHLVLTEKRRRRKQPLHHSVTSFRSLPQYLSTSSNCSSDYGSMTVIHLNFVPGVCFTAVCTFIRWGPA